MILVAGDTANYGQDWMERYVNIEEVYTIDLFVSLCDIKQNIILLLCIDDIPQCYVTIEHECTNIYLCTICVCVTTYNPVLARVRNS